MPPDVTTFSRNTGAPSAVDGSVTWNFCVSVETFAAVIVVSLVLLPLCA